MSAENGGLSFCSAALLFAVLVASKLLLPWTVYLSVCLLLLFYRSHVVVLAKTFRRDMRWLRILRTTYGRLRKCEKNNMTILDLFKRQLDKNPEKPVLYYEDETWTYSDMNEFSCRVANAFRSAGYKKGDVVALLMGNRPEYVGIWFGLAKIGGVTALINTNLRNRALVHCLTTAGVKGLVYSEEFESAVEELGEKIDGIEKFRWGSGEGKESESVRCLRSMMESGSGSEPTPDDVVGYRDRVLYVYTSGTTGLPKAAIIPHHRLVMMSMALYCIMGINESDVVYNPLPLFHVSGGLLGIVGPLSHGFATVIRKKFSASAYWPDCIKYNCTVAQYIGEMCRYVMMVPPRPEDTMHKVRLVFGNGMKISLWRKFQKRFGIRQISEIYGSTEGNTNLVNIDRTVGAVGFLPRLLPQSLIPMAIIKVNEFSEPVRNSKGFCIRCKPNEPGMFIGMIVTSDATREYSGYVGDKKETEKKIIENVFKKGDRAFLSGDILVMDELGYLYFKDRTGDTYKWKGENVSTAEVEGIISEAVGLRDVLVYGVEVGSLEGKAGMATIVDPDSSVDLEALGAELERNLPSYARPLFVRLTDRVDLTGTYKLKKLNFQREGFDPEKVGKDKLFFKSGNGYVELTKQIYEDLISDKIRV